MQTQSSDENSLYVCQTRDLSQHETMIIMSRSLVFREENSWWGQPILSEILGQPAPLEQNIVEFQLILTLIGSRQHAFQWA